MHRADVVATAKSLYRISAVLPAVRIIYVLGKLSGFFVEKASDSLGFNGKLCRDGLSSDLTLGVFVTAMLCDMYSQPATSGGSVDPRITLRGPGRESAGDVPVHHGVLRTAAVARSTRHQGLRR